jgi:putative tRNA adenosine deaminase-associated protein
VSYFAAAAVRGPKGWAATEVDLSGVADLDEVADRLRDVDPDADVSLLFVESDDTYLVILRLDEGEDLRIFGSDSVFADESRLGALLLGEVETPAVRLEDAEELARQAEASEEQESDDAERAEAGQPDVDPVGDSALLADLGVSARQLLAVCSHDGLLPADMTAELCQAIGCGDELEELREA